MILMFYFGILRIFGEKSQKSTNWKSRHIGLLRRSVGNPRRLRQGVGCLAAVRPRCQNGTPRVRAWSRYCSQREKFWILF